MTVVELDEVVRTNPKRRFAFDDSQTRIRANQGHSVDVSLGYQEQVPPKHLFHGTVERFVYSIENEGIRKGERHHVHLSSDLETAKTVGSRRGSPLIFRVAAAAMAADGYRFYRSDNGVWLTEHVPPIPKPPDKGWPRTEASEGTKTEGYAEISFNRIENTLRKRVVHPRQRVDVSQRQPLNLAIQRETFLRCT